jgi:phosphate transport system protein
MNGKETQIRQDIAQLRTRLLVMCAAVGIALDEACEALVSGDAPRAGAVVDGDAAVDAMENEIDEAALILLVRGQPVAQDLRFVVAALRIIIELERIGDEASDLAERAVILNERLPESVREGVRDLMDTARMLYRKAVESFRTEDAEQALQLSRMDEEVTQMEVRALHHIMERFCPGGREGRSGLMHACMHGILICRALNRICRRAANIGEQTYFILRGINIRHAHQPV